MDNNKNNVKRKLNNDTTNIIILGAYSPQCVSFVTIKIYNTIKQAYQYMQQFTKTMPFIDEKETLTESQDVDRLLWKNDVNNQEFKLLNIEFIQDPDIHIIAFNMPIGANINQYADECFKYFNISNKDLIKEYEYRKKNVECGCCMDNSLTKCAIKDCKKFMCYKCSTDGLILEEWLEVSATCTKCKRIVCNDCIRTCYSCANENGDAKEFCKECVDYKDNGCNRHKWFVCEDTHENIYEGCATCGANKNFCDKMA